MAKKTVKKEEGEIKPFEITSAILKDGFCKYTFDVKAGVGVGDTHTVNGKGIIDLDLESAFSDLDVHLACIDDVFEHSGTEVNNISAMMGHELTQLYAVTGFKIKGSKEDEHVILMGTKRINSVAGRVEIETPKIPLISSSYKWYNELQALIVTARKEVELYKEGKCTIPAKEDVTDPAQTALPIDFEGGKV